MGRTDSRAPLEVDADLTEQFDAMGAAVDPASHAGAGGAVYRVWSVNWPAVQVFMACQTQWRLLPTQAGLIWMGLDYQAVDVVLRRLRIDDPAGHIWAQIQAMELAALAVFAEDR